MISYHDIISCGRGKAAATSNDFCMGNIRFLEIFTFQKSDVFYKYMFYQNILKPYHENRNKIPDRSVVLMSEIDMKSLKLLPILFLCLNLIK